MNIFDEILEKYTYLIGLTNVWTLNYSVRRGGTVLRSGSRNHPERKESIVFISGGSVLNWDGRLPLLYTEKLLDQPAGSMLVCPKLPLYQS